MSDEARDRLILADIAGMAARHVPLSGPFPYGEAAAITAVRAVARGRPDLLAQHAGTCLGLSLTQPVDHLAGQLVAQASLAARAGADMELIARWITAGIARVSRSAPATDPASSLRAGR